MNEQGREQPREGIGRKQEALDYFRSKGQLEKAREVLKLFSTAKKSASLYPPNHEICINSFTDFMRAFKEYLSWREEFSLRIVGEEFFFEEKLMPRESVLYYPLIKELVSKGIGGINILASLDAAEFVDFLYLLNRGSDELERYGGLRRLMEDKEIESIILDEPGTWEEKTREIKERHSAREEYFDAVDVIRELADQVLSDRRLSVSKANRVVGVMLNRVGENRSAVLGLATMKNYDEYTSFHSVNVLILSLALGSMLPLDRSALMILGTGALLHDLGKITIPQSVLKKSGPLTSQEWEMMKAHPVKGADILMAQPGVHLLSVMVAYEHHARYDLSGYPDVKGKERIGLFSRIVEVCDVYDAMTSARPYQKARTPDQAMRVLVKDMGTAFDPLLVKVFIDMMGLFPVGTMVRLATGEVGVIYEPGENDALWPRVKVIRDAEGGEVEPRIVDLVYLKDKIGETGQAILEALHPETLGIDPQTYL
ncbi:MAG: HD-GYP domain-containing protein [Actinomycetota bacterium]|nr:HD-GYP domain-containing protein [Actinomycetota bacterium]